jgi:hypothetical protein
MLEIANKQREALLNKYKVESKWITT